MNFGQNLRNLRKSRNISQEELAEKVNVSRQSVSKWETGEAYPEMNNILMLCRIFHCKINDLVNNNILDIDSLDEDVKMSVVKFKDKKQKQIKGISNILSLIGKIGAIVVKVLLPFVIVFMIAIPIILKDIKVEGNKIVSNSSNITISEFMDNEYYNESKFIDYKLSKIKNDLEKIKYTLEITLTKIDGKWYVDELSKDYKEKIYGIYNYQ